MTNRERNEWRERVRDRLKALKNGAWRHNSEAGTIVAEYDQGPPLNVTRQRVVATVRRPDGQQSDPADIDLIAHAPADLEFLLGELDAISKQLHDVIEEHGLTRG